ncbi:MAG: inositol monophosphatase family protein [Magnetovibrionaceae bacterium]
MPADRETVTDIIREAAETFILPRFRHLEDSQVRSKDHAADLVTVADEESESFLSEALSKLLPDSLVVGEEATAADPSVLSRLMSDKPVWVLDPVDGTHNFAHGKERFCVLVALVQRNETLAGWLHDPLTNTTYWAGRGEGAWDGDQALNVATTKPIRDMTASLSRRLAEKILVLGREKTKEVVRYRCAGHEYRDLANGTLDFGRYGGQLKPWDHAAGTLLVREAGGRAAHVDGRDYVPLGAPEGSMLVAPDETWETLNKHFCA